MSVGWAKSDISKLNEASMATGKRSDFSQFLKQNISFKMYKTASAIKNNPIYKCALCVWPYDMMSDCTIIGTYLKG